MFANNLSDKALLPRKYKELSKFNNTKINNPILKKNRQRFQKSPCHRRYKNENKHMCGQEMETTEVTFDR